MVIPTNKFKINRVNLEFKKRSIEEKYISETLFFNIKNFQLICIIAFAIHSIYIVKDFFWTYNNAVSIRAFVLIPAFIIGYIITRLSVVKNNASHFYKLVIIIVLLAVFGQLLIVWKNPATYTQISHSIPIIIYGMYIFSGLKFKHILYYLGSITLVIPLLFMWYLMDYTLSDKINVTIILVINYFIATVAKYNIGIFQRKYFRKKEIEIEQKNIILKFNKDLHYQKELYSGLIERSDDLVSLKGSDGKLEFVSKSSENILGYRPEELVGTYADKYIYANDLDKLENARKTTVSGKLSYLDYRMIHKSGKIIWVRSTGMPIMDEDNKLISVQGSLRDISELKEIELKQKEYREHLERLNSQKNRFFSIVSHDLKGPINNIVSLATMLSHSINADTKEESTKIMHHLESSSQNSKELLDNLLTWSKTQLDGFVVNKSSIDLNAIVSENIRLLNPLAQHKGITLLADIDNNLMIYADLEMIKTVIRNLLSNAIKFSYNEKLVKVYTMNKTKDSIEIVIEDNGVGISEDRLHKLFNLGEKKSTQGTNKEIGTGLGLVICEDFVKLNNGKIRIESKINVGTKIIFSTPLANSILLN